MMLAWYGAEAGSARLRLAVAAPLAPFWVARDLLLPVLWVRAWTLKGYEWRGSAVDVRPPARTPATPSGLRLRLSRPR